jgi:hypothetical protein
MCPLTTFFDAADAGGCSREQRRIGAHLQKAQGLPERGAVATLLLHQQQNFVRHAAAVDAANGDIVHATQEIVVLHVNMPRDLIHLKLGVSKIQFDVLGGQFDDRDVRIRHGLNVTDPGAVPKDVFEAIDFAAKEVGAPIAPPRANAMRVNVVSCTGMQQHSAQRLGPAAMQVHTFSSTGKHQMLLWGFTLHAFLLVSLTHSYTPLGFPFNHGTHA